MDTIPYQTNTSNRLYYEENGYVVYPKLILHSTIDRVLDLYRRDIWPSTLPFFRQSSGRYEKSRRNAHQYILQSFLDIHDYEQFPEFSHAALELFTGSEMRRALGEISGYSAFNLMQTMLFDANTATQAHQDWWYLDTVPNGNLTAAWIALEDIDERAGRFYVVKKSTSVDLHSDTPNLPHTEWIKRVQGYVAKHSELVVAPPLKKGDVLFWNSRTIHGALPTKDDRFSRKSLTAHYIPSELKFGNLFKTKDYVQYKECQGMRFFKNQPDYSLVNHMKAELKLKVYNSPRVLKLLRKFQGKF